MALTLEEMTTPLTYRVGNASEAGFDAPPDRHGRSIRTYVRSLEGIQKEAVTVSRATGLAWRYASDEGVHLNGRDAATNPLSFVAVGMVASYMSELLALAAARGIALRGPELTLENFYYRAGSFPRGTMISGALPPSLTLVCDTDASEDEITRLLADAVVASPLNGLTKGENVSLFTIVHNGRELVPAGVAPLGAPAEADRGDRFDALALAPDAERFQPLTERIGSEEAMKARLAASPEPAPSVGEGEALLHLRSVCRILPNGVKEIVREQYKMPSSTWRFLCDEAKGEGGEGRAPDALSYFAAGLAFCFMTQLGRYAHMAKLPLHAYRVIQDTHFSPGGGSAGTGRAGRGDPVETHVALETGLDDAAAQDLVRVGERTCFLHALCRDDVKVKTRYRRRGMRLAG
ncbi:OsmC family protein [Acuticoccus mangrovi]|uniref:OsmC family protein n=1 Tax=Acuticoccus mangrovi TaxID=2796142 RepID=A0A934IG09_9HYPH|nr:OsmC family protein [Acuticoccus mangrovi]MBJ3775788.1 OsmC family protein [Acuticoccus mangrovi]